MQDKILKQLKRFRLPIAGLTVLTFLTYFFRPWVHGLSIFLYKSPYIWQTFLLFAALLGYAINSIRKSEENKAPRHLNTGATIAFIFLIAGVALSGAFSMTEMAENVQKDVKELDKLPDIDPKSPRILPKSVAEEYASNSLQTPRYTLGGADIAVSENRTLYWSMPKKPDGLYNKFALKQEGAAFVDMSTQNKRIKYTEDKMTNGIGMGITDNVMWSLKKEKYWVEYEDPINLEHDGKTYIAVPYKDFNFHFTSPIFYTTPEWAGVALVNPEGETKFLTPEKAAENEVLSDQRLYPHELARTKVSSLAYKHGILNAWFTHRDQLEVAPVPGVNNDQPFTVMTEDGVKLFVAAEPYGNAQGLFQIWTVDADTGKYSVLKLNRSEALLGAEKATNYVRKSKSTVNWADISSGEKTVQTGFKPSEPIPVVVEDRLYWQVRVVPLDSAGIAFTSFVNAQTGDVITAETDEEIKSFLENRETENNTGNRTGKTRSDKSDGWNILITEDGKLVRKVQVGENQTVKFQRAE